MILLRAHDRQVLRIPACWTAFRYDGHCYRWHPKAGWRRRKET